MMKWPQFLADFKNLRVLRLDRTSISDKALSYLHGSELKVLNLCNTSVTFSGVSLLLKSTKLEKVYAWNTSIRDESKKPNLAALGSGLINFGTSNLFPEKLSLRDPEITTYNTIFKDSVSVYFKNIKLKTFKFVTLQMEVSPTEILLYIWIQLNYIIRQ